MKFFLILMILPLLTSCFFQVPISSGELIKYKEVVEKEFLFDESNEKVPYLFIKDGEYKVFTIKKEELSYVLKYGIDKYTLNLEDGKIIKHTLEKRKFY